MKFDYYTLKDHAKANDSIGVWRADPVYVCSKYDLSQKNFSYKNFYILYDDKNKIIHRKRDGYFYCYGTVDQNGTVHEYDQIKLYLKQEEKKEEEREEKKEEVIGDVKMGIDVEGTLKGARELSINDLLKGFNYGL